MADFCMLLAVVTWFLNVSQIALLSINRIQEDAFVPNLVHIGRETAEESCLEKKKRNRQKNIILPKF